MDAAVGELLFRHGFFRVLRAGSVSAGGEAPGGRRTNLKGRMNFSTLGTAPGRIITLSDSNFQKTIATANNRPSNDANDAFIGYDHGDGNPTHVGISFGAPQSLSNYIGNDGDGTKWLERLTSALKMFRFQSRFRRSRQPTPPIPASRAQKPGTPISSMSA